MACTILCVHVGCRKDKIQCVLYFNTLKNKFFKVYNIGWVVAVFNSITLTYVISGNVNAFTLDK